MYKANRRDGLCERSKTMFPVGIDVSKSTLDLCMLYDGIKGRIKTRNTAPVLINPEQVIG